MASRVSQRGRSRSISRRARETARPEPPRALDRHVVLRELLQAASSGGTALTQRLDRHVVLRYLPRDRLEQWQRATGPVDSQRSLGLTAVALAEIGPTALALAEIAWTRTRTALPARARRRSRCSPASPSPARTSWPPASTGPRPRPLRQPAHRAPGSRPSLPEEGCAPLSPSVRAAESVDGRGASQYSAITRSEPHRADRRPRREGRR